ncbi:hypothetical protein OG455_00340 [Kitasatospora sp. NBC_01287]|uniref:hypothetical protein n=1 Tax=Kitasatospora sp. NBC_01287 TaxID=2903573 RepID=UPI002259738C|nr:hypothetical protein [Kitasatospora sp. NBC_01287]MCX4743974.1 hypothetical protein [Kitasatospora sp. NBC_01287]
MSVDFAAFDLTELAVLDAADLDDMSATRSPYPARFAGADTADDMDDLLSKSAVVEPACCSCSSSVSCCCTG